MKSKTLNKQRTSHFGSYSSFKQFIAVGFLDHVSKEQKPYAKRCFNIAYNYLIKINKFQDYGSIYVFPIILRLLKTNTKLTVGEIRFICTDIVNRLTKSIARETKQYKDTQYDIEVEMVMYYSNKIIHKLKNRNNEI